MEKRFVLRNEKVAEHAVSAVLAAAEEGTTNEVLIRPYKSRRSRDQNDMMWAIMRAIAKHTGDDVNSVKEVLQRKFLGLQTKEALGDTVTFIRPTSDLNVEEFSEFLEQLQAFANEWGVRL